MGNYKVVKYSSLYYEEWNAFVLNAKNATFLFHRDFMEYHQDRFEDFSLMVFKNDHLIAVLPANKLDNRLFSHQGLTYGGFVVGKKLKFQDFIKSFKVLLETLDDYGFLTLEIKVIPYIYTELPSDDINCLMFILEAKLIQTNILSVVDLGKQIKFTKSRIEGCNRGKKNNLEIREVDSLKEFWDDILIPNLKSKYKTDPVHSLTEITLLKNRFPENIRQFNVYHDDDIVAGVTIFETKKVAHAQYISANSYKNTLGSLDFLHEYLIKKKFKNKAYFDFGTSNENQGRNINKGLLFWKEGFGAKVITQNFYRINVNGYNKLNHIML
ncbi:GNAT family N-acetyltransferase [Flavivirga sp. 57AJ16]|uniref:GNAT family N-acetyltransferase n=1 Tax=Flavivirga sp. 57AJ16 TaxID=3025307 RepID=UPI0023671950|nr:GNAT family N-acetyltransferase [Flavivirga sp. 57AJ16]MDD7885343.1 GNAT family N-acetyltransferase [Flavivirga sp. 57AJ16]